MENGLYVVHSFRSMTRPCGKGDLVEDVVFADGFFHRDAFDDLEGVGVHDQHGAVHFPHGDEGVFAVAVEFHVGHRLARGVV